MHAGYLVLAPELRLFVLRRDIACLDPKMTSTNAHQETNDDKKSYLVHAAVRSARFEKGSRVMPLLAATKKSGYTHGPSLFSA
jgi:hypothetical protein